ncbi:MAG: sensor histidine kinase [Hamadaea sp.]|uniref:sensor histidine kinase n=1 Tax=Hamadaea sp. TaxID=2024425 RepID=UPI0017C9AD21|nr:sensor histidine kinase [Hamadaea sp.]NUT18763.1 sensor histidine kinase [Hamadaea sp.]
MSEAAARSVEGWAARLSDRVRGLAAAHPVAVDGAIATVAGVSVLTSSAVGGAGRTAAEHTLAVALVVVAAGTLAVRRQWPMAVLAVTYGAAAAYLSVGLPPGPVVQLPGFALYTVAAWRPLKTSAAACLLAVGGALILARGDSALFLFLLGWLALPWGLGVAVRAYRRVRDELVRGQRLAAAAGERLAMATEVHDAVGHSLSVISMRAGVALHVLADRPEEAEAALRVIREVSGQTLAELRATLAAFPSAAASRQGGLGSLPTLVRNVSGGGLTVNLTLTGTAARVAEPVDQAAYRIIQEALTNVLRHSQATRAEVGIAFAPTELTLSICDDGTAEVAFLEGRGLAGMRERASSLGGTLSAGPQEGGGFAVRATLPYEVRP